MTGLEFTLVLIGATTLACGMMRVVRFIETGK